MSRLDGRWAHIPHVAFDGSVRMLPVELRNGAPPDARYVDEPMGDGRLWRRSFVMRVFRGNDWRIAYVEDQGTPGDNVFQAIRAAGVEGFQLAPRKKSAT